MLYLMLAAVLAAPARSPADYAIIQGRTLIVTRTRNAVAIAVDTDYDGSLDDLFWFYSKTPPSLRVYSEQASIEFRGDELVVVSADTGETHVFSVGRPRVAVHHIHDLPEISSAAYAGYGISHKMGPSVNAIRLFSSNGHGRLKTEESCTDGGDPCLLNPDDGGGGGTSCDSGGLGSSSCSVTRDGNSCSVSCVAGYYACCNRRTRILGPPSCTCVAN